MEQSQVQYVPGEADESQVEKGGQGEVLQKREGRDVGEIELKSGKNTAFHLNDFLLAISELSCVHQVLYLWGVYLLHFGGHQHRADAQQLEFTSANSFGLDEPVHDVDSQKETLVRQFEFSGDVDQPVDEDCPHGGIKLGLPSEPLGLNQEPSLLGQQMIQDLLPEGGGLNVDRCLNLIIHFRLFFRGLVMKRQLAGRLVRPVRVSRTKRVRLAAPQPLFEVVKKIGLKLQFHLNNNYCEERTSQKWNQTMSTSSSIYKSQSSSQSGVSP